MNPGGLVNRLEIALYSTLTSALSGFNHLRAKVRRTNDPDDWLPAEDEALSKDLDEPSNQKKIWLSWETIKTSIMILVLWMVLGFAAGFLIGMIKPW